MLTKLRIVRKFYEPSYGVRFRRLSDQQIQFLYEEMLKLKESWAKYQAQRERDLL